MTNKTSSKQTTILIIVALISVTLGIWVNQNLPRERQLPQDLEATYLPQGKPLAPFQLIDHDNEPFDQARLQGKWSFMFFGYTHCPDVCPMTMKVMEQAWKQIPQAVGQEAQMIFVSVDTDRDPPEKLKAYVQYFHKDFIGITGKTAQLDILTRSIGILYGFEDPAPGSNEYIVNHSGQIVLIDPNANLRAVFSPPHDGNKIASTFAKIRDFATN